MDERAVTRGLAWTRIVLGAGLFLMPRRLARMWVGRDGDGAFEKMASRGMGGRDIALGLGILIALERDKPVRGWLEASAVADLSDALATVAAGSYLPWWRRIGLVALEGGTAALEMQLAAEIDD